MSGGAERLRQLLILAVGAPPNHREQALFPQTYSRGAGAQVHTTTSVVKSSSAR